jgi:hypothetical protein
LAQQPTHLLLSERAIAIADWMSRWWSATRAIEEMKHET